MALGRSLREVAFTRLVWFEVHKLGVSGAREGEAREQQEFTSPQKGIESPHGAKGDQLASFRDCTSVRKDAFSRVRACRIVA